MIKIVLLENLRFDPGEEANSAEFIKIIINATGAEVYVQDGFAVVHRAHASTSAVAKFLPVYMGLLLEKEVTNLEKVADDPEKPVLLIIGGSKVDDKKPLTFLVTIPLHSGRYLNSSISEKSKTSTWKSK